MKKTLLSILLVGLLYSCSDSDDALMCVAPASNERAMAPAAHHNSSRSEADALSIAAQLLDNIDVDELSVVPLCDDAKQGQMATMSLSSSTVTSIDTLAYVVNAADDKGFALIAYDGAVPPVLAHSETGSFSLEDEHYQVIYDNFISGIPAYVEQQRNTLYYEWPDVLPMMKELMAEFPWHQGDEFATYVQVEHPSCPVGCVPLAALYNMVYAKDELVLHDEYFDLAFIRQAMTDYYAMVDLDYDTYMPDLEEWIQCKADYAVAIDNVAKLVYYCGQDLGTTYDIEGSSTFSAFLGPFFAKNGYSIYPAYTGGGYALAKYNIDEIFDLMTNSNAMIYISGTNSVDGKGHAWVIDAAKFDLDRTTTPWVRSNIRFRCNWGWGGGYNGYYSGDVFELVSTSGNKIGSYKRMNYIAVIK